MPIQMPRTPEEWNEYDALHPGADPLAEAQIALKNANDFGAENHSARLAALPESLAGLRSAADTRGMGRKITEGLARGGEVLGTASLPALAINPAIAGGMATAGGLATLPDYLRRLVSPDANESHPGTLESGMEALAVLPAMGSARKALSGLKVAGKWQAAKELPYAMDGAVAGGLNDISQWEKAPQNLEGALSHLDDTISAHHTRTANADGYAQELSRMSRTRPTQNATEAFDKMSSNGELGMESKGFTDRQYNIDLTDELGALDSTPVNTRQALFDKAMSSSGRYGPTSTPRDLSSYQGLAGLLKGVR